MGKRFSACESPTRSRRDRSVLALTSSPLRKLSARSHRTKTFGFSQPV